MHKARYFPRSSFFEADLGNNPSYAWQSILVAKDTVEAGSRLGIGRGDSVTIWNVENGMVSTDVPVGIEDVRVLSLIRTDAHVWGVDLIRDLFVAHDVDLICSNPFSKLLIQDSWYWIFDKTRTFSVHSYYCFFQSEIQ